MIKDSTEKSWHWSVPHDNTKSRCGPRARVRLTVLNYKDLPDIPNDMSPFWHVRFVPVKFSNKTLPAVSQLLFTRSHWRTSFSLDMWRITPLLFKHKSTWTPPDVENSIPSNILCLEQVFSLWGRIRMYSNNVSAISNCGKPLRHKSYESLASYQEYYFVLLLDGRLGSYTEPTTMHATFSSVCCV